MAKKYDWAKLPEGVTPTPFCIRPTLSWNGYEYHADRGSLHVPLSSDPDAAAEAYARLRAAAKACEVDWYAEWCAARGCTPTSRTEGEVCVSCEGLTLYGSPHRKYFVRLCGISAPSGYAITRIAEIIGKLKAAGWVEG